MKTIASCNEHHITDSPLPVFNPPTVHCQEMAPRYTLALPAIGSEGDLPACVDMSLQLFLQELEAIEGQMLYRGAQPSTIT